MKFSKKPMVNWYDLKQLASTGVKTLISGVFGNFADKREFQAASARDEKLFDYSAHDKEEFWLDYISDLGDGFNPTYSMAHLMAQEELEVHNFKTKRGSVLIMGGDEVYPTPEKHEYDNRLKGPYFAAFPWNEAIKTDLYVIPGNHDWYDGLTNFMKVFCQDRSIGNWKTHQKRSYFALKLPFNYWVFAVDIQLHADIDEPQLKYFCKISEEEVKKGDKIILCTAEPSWVYKAWSMKNTSDDRMRFFIDTVIFGKSKKYYGRQPDDVKVVAILTGDMHHYSHYLEEEKVSGQLCHLITAGGGGAFTHPTHFLKDYEDQEVTRKLISEPFPSKKQSKRLAWWNLAFPFYSPHMVALFSVLHFLTFWLLLSFGHYGTDLVNKLGMAGGMSEISELFLSQLAYNPPVVIINLILLLGLTFFTDTATGKGSLNMVVGFIHGLVQVLHFYAVVWLYAYLTQIYWPDTTGVMYTLFCILMILGVGLISAFIFGKYLLFSTLIIKNHPTEAFSSFRWEGYKNFLRIKITKDGAQIYAIGVKQVPTNWKNAGASEKPCFEGGPIKAQLIEKPFNINS
ncbi:metallophosphoesterase [Fulvivirga maritima]|uniref:metallophosphoesterase n=1 Tax=Fulvivirga maritima TaxID=2904247 RepID=UPI001F32A8E8|nr:metallophosphoesterase [Fulvivirga maritima]UII25975.1 metallophosphoesterase [Fulvivirga maritima]